MKGDELARQVRQLRPGAGIIFATGQNEVPDGAAADAVLLKKPYSDDALKRALDQVR